MFPMIEGDGHREGEDGARGCKSSGKTISLWDGGPMLL